MTAAQVPDGPIETDPAGDYLDVDARLGLLLAALGDVVLGAHDRHVLAWVAGWDPGTVRTIGSLIERAKTAAVRPEAAEALAALQRAIGTLDELRAQLRLPGPPAGLGVEVRPPGPDPEASPADGEEPDRAAAYERARRARLREGGEVDSE